MPDLTKMSVQSLCDEYRNAVLAESRMGVSTWGLQEAIIAELTRRTEVAKGGCAFCNDCDAVRCPPSQRQLLFKMCEQSGKRNWWNVLHYSMEFHRAVISLLHQDLNATREAALAAKGVEG